MLPRPSLLLVVPVFLLAATVPAAEPLFDSRPGHPWDQLREAFFVRRFTSGEVFDHPHASAPPWHEFMPFTRDAAFHDRVVALLETVEKLPPARMEEQAAARRLVLLRDLWAVFDALRWAHNRWPGGEDKDVAAKALARRDELVHRIARVMRRLELTEDEVLALPNAFNILADKKLFPKTFDPAAGDKAFFPSDLLDKDGPWVTYSGEKEPSAGGVLHTTFVNQRSVFTLHLRTPGGRDGNVTFFRDHIKAERRLDVPPGSTLALLGRAVVPTRSGKLLVSPLVESLQLIVVTPPKDHRFKFAFDRKEFLAGGLGLKPLGKDDPADFSSFGDAVLWGHPVDPRKKDANGETFITGKYNTVRDMPRAMDVCARCHRDTLGNSIIGSGGPLLPHAQSDPDKADAAVLKKKESSTEWKTYLRLSGRVPSR